LIAALWRTHLGQEKRQDPATALRATLEQLVGLCQEHGCSLTANIIVANAEGFTAVRFAFNQEPNSLYRLANRAPWKGGYLVASEPLDGEAGWEAIDPSVLVRVDKGGMRTTSLNGRGAAPQRALGIRPARKAPSAPIRNGKRNATARRK
jgi:predicted glutamine amidotransferase